MSRISLRRHFLPAPESLSFCATRGCSYLYCPFSQLVEYLTRLSIQLLSQDLFPKLWNVINALTVFNSRAINTIGCLKCKLGEGNYLHRDAIKCALKFTSWKIKHSRDWNEVKTRHSILFNRHFHYGAKPVKFRFYSQLDTNNLPLLIPLWKQYERRHPHTYWKEFFLKL